MKKIIALASICALAFSLSACGEDKTSDGDNGGVTDQPIEKEATPETPDTPEQKTGLISTTEDVEQPDQEKEEVAVDDADALEKKWTEMGEAFAKEKGFSTFGVNTVFQNFSSDKIESYQKYLNHNDTWKAGDKVKVSLYCQTVEPATMKIWIAPDSDEEGTKGQLTEVGCGVDTPSEASWEYTLPTDTDNLMLVQYQIPVEGFYVLLNEKQ